MGEIIIGGVEEIGARDKGIEVGMGVAISEEEIVEMEGMPSWGKSKCGDVGVVWGGDKVEIIGEVRGEIELGTSISNEGVLVVSIRIRDKLILEK